MKKKSIHFCVPYQIYPFDCEISVNEPKAVFTARLKRRLQEDMHHEVDEEFSCDYQARTVMFSGGQTAIHITLWPQRASQHAIIVHEVFHAVHFLMSRLNMELTYANCEAYAYLQQYLIEQIFKAMEMKPKWLELAEAELGVTETPGALSNDRVVEYHKWTSLRASSDEVAWCSAFVNFCVRNSGVKGTNSAAARSWLDWGEPCEPQEGCIVVMSRGKNPALGHVGFYAGKKNGLVGVLGGNQKDSVCYSWFPVSSVLGYRWSKEDT